MIHSPFLGCSPLWLVISLAILTSRTFCVELFFKYLDRISYLVLTYQDWVAPLRVRASSSELRAGFIVEHELDQKATKKQIEIPTIHFLRFNNFNISHLMIPPLIHGGIHG
jgi:hypothetical protein